MIFYDEIVKYPPCNLLKEQIPSSLLVEKAITKLNTTGSSALFVLVRLAVF